MSTPPSLAQWLERGRIRTVLGRQIFVIDEAGSGDTILLLHGFPTASWDFWRIWPALGARHRLLAADFLGFGFSAKPRGHDYSIHEQADLIEDIVRAHGVGEYHVLAHDYGVSVAQELLARDNVRGDDRRCLSVSLLNGGLFPETHRARPVQRLLHGPLGPLLVRALSRAALARSMRAIFGPDTPPSEEDLDAFWGLINRDDGRLVLPRLLRYIRDRRTHRNRWVAALAGTQTPLQLINGSADPVSGAHMVARYRELVGDENIVELPRIGHYPQVEAPAAVAEHYLAFLADSGAAAR